MPDINSPGQEPSEKRPFIREKIARPPMTRRQLIKRMAAFVFIAALGGAAAGASCAVMRPLAVEQPEEESVPVTIPKDEPESSTGAGESGTAPGESQPGEGESQTEETEGESSTEESGSLEETEPETETEEETEPIEEVIESVLETRSYSARDLDGLYGVLGSLVREADKGIVEVHSLRQETDWFDNSVETAGLYAGAVIASTGQELLILTPDKAVENADSIKVTFGDSTQADGMI